MTVITWQMQERFSFPQELGVPADMTTVRITPQWHEEQLEESIRLTGIYHIAANVAFTEGEPKETDAVFIDQLDVGETDSYFEYALPLEVDLAKEKVKGDVRLHISDIDSAVENGQTIVTWQMNCSYEEVEEQVAIKDTAHSKVKEQVAIEDTAHSKVKEQVAIEETAPSIDTKDEIVFEQVPPVHEDDFYKELAEAYTIFQSNLNKVRRQ